MRYIVFSFDDGLKDFKENALPILNKYRIKASLNIISGFSDKSVAGHYDCLTPEEVKELYNQGFEIANHTDSHLKHGSYEEFELCNKKLNEWCGTNKVFGVVMPKYSHPSKSAIKYVEDNNPPYITYEGKRNYSFLLIRIYRKLLYMLNHNQVNFYKYLVVSKMYKKGKSNYFSRLEVGQNVNPNALYRSLRVLRPNCGLTLVFHSITNNLNENIYPKGAYSIANFDELCRLIIMDSDYRIIIQSSL